LTLTNSAPDSAGQDKRKKYVKPRFESSGIMISSNPGRKKKARFFEKRAFFYFFILKN